MGPACNKNPVPTSASAGPDEPDRAADSSDVHPSIARSKLGGSPADRSGPTDPLQVMTWNLEWFYDEHAGDNFSDLAMEKSAPDRSRWNWRRDAVADSIAAVRPTVLAVQEVENRRVLWYLSQSLNRRHQLEYDEFAVEGRDFFTEQDVGFLIRPPADLAALVQHGYPKGMRSSNQFYDVTKHLTAQIEWSSGSQRHRVHILNVHLRAKPEGEPFRLRQARLIHHWLRETLASGQDVIVLGDFNSEESGRETRRESEVGIACGLETDDPGDDLVDLNLRLPVGDRQTHMIPGKQFDRILCSRSLLEDDPSKPDLVFSKIEVLRRMSIRGAADNPEQHWENYWNLSDRERDLSDHYPVMATFDVR